MRQKWRERIYDRYGFVDAFNPNNGWVNPDVLGLDVGITLISAENLRTGNVWLWFMLNKEIPRAMRLAGFRKVRRSTRVTKVRAQILPPASSGKMNQVAQPGY